ncbi:MAG: outer membrane lipoprotein carrier protein LolA [Methylococcaceae bacterium]|nr:outer membrane lipoprotein carrier protein LolA [Methylococcaceae bacterium]
MIILRVLLLILLSLNNCIADDVLARITPQLSQKTITQGLFQQEKRLKFLNKPLLSAGSFSYDQSKGVIWKTITPIPSLLLVNDEHLLTAQGEQALPPAFARVFKALLGGELNRLSEGFEITGKEQKTSWQLQLTPKDELLKKVIKTILLSGDSELRLLELQEANSNLTRIKFSEISHPDRLSNEQQAEFERLSP